MSSTFLKFVFKATLVGPQNSGKSQLLNRLLGNDFLPTILPTSGVAHTFKMLPISSNFAEGQIHYWDTSGDPSFHDVIDAFVKHSNAFIYCIDLTHEMDVDRVNQDIHHYLSISPNTPVILVGTQKDSSQTIPEERLEQFKTQIHLQQNLRFITSAKDGLGFAELSNGIMDIVHREYQIQFKQHQWNDAVRNLQANLAGLNKKKAQGIQDQFSQMVAELGRLPLDHGAEAIDTFVNKSKAILRGDHSNVMNAVIRIAAVAVITILAGLLGFGLGFAAGLWIGPGALLTGFIGIGAGATIGSAISMGIIGHRWFKESSRNAALNQFATEAKCSKEPIDPIPLQP